MRPQGRRARGPADVPVMVLSSSAMENVRPLALAGLRSALVGLPRDPAKRSRWTTTAFDRDWTMPIETHGAELVERFEQWGRSHPHRPTIMPCGEESLVFLSRYRDRLTPYFRFVLPDADLVEALVDKTRFADLARARGLPIPSTTVLTPDALLDDQDLSLRYPVLVKPLNRDARWSAVAPANGKALYVENEAALRRLRPALAGLGVALVAQHHVDGPESAIESHHVYIDETDEIRAEFTGKKIRTLPVRYGHTTALTVGWDEEVVELGRAVARRLGLRGVAKTDFKRGPDGRLLLLEVNPRFNLWHHPGARAGVNLPAVVHADLHGRTGPTPRVVRRVDWCHPLDLLAARREGVGLARWGAFASRCAAKAYWAPDDPLPFLAAMSARAAPALRRPFSDSPDAGH